MRIEVIALSIVFMTLTSCFAKSHLGNVTIFNRATEPISKVEVTVQGKTMKFENLGPSQSVRADYEVKSDGGFEVTGSFKSGRPFSKTDGYITNGMDFNHEIVIDDSSVTIESKPAK